MKSRVKRRINEVKNTQLLLTVIGSVLNLTDRRGFLGASGSFEG